MSSKQISRGILLMVGSGILFALMAVYIKELSQRLSFLEIGFFRSLLSLPFLLPWMLLTRASFRLKRGKLMFARSLIGWLAMLCNFYALAVINVSDASILNYTAPLWVFLFAELYLKEKVPAFYWIILSLAFAGVTLVLKPHFEVWNWGGLVGLLGGALVGWVYLMLKKLNQSEKPETIVLYFTVYATLLFIPFLPPVWIWPNPREWLELLAVGALATAAQIMLTRAYRFGQAATISLFNYANVLAAIFWAWILLGETLSVSSMAGIFLIVTCVALINRYENKLVQKIRIR